MRVIKNVMVTVQPVADAWIGIDAARVQPSNSLLLLLMQLKNDRRPNSREEGNAIAD